MPTLDAAIPDVLVPAAGRRRPATLARFLLDAGVIAEDQPAAAAGGTNAICQQCLSHWLSERVGPLKCLRPGFTLHLGGGADADGDRAGLVGTLMWSGDPQVWVVGPALDRLEVICPGLGATVLSTIESQGWLSLPVFTPWEALGAASYVYWYGEEDEETALDENCGEHQEARAEMIETMVTRAKVGEAFPAWALACGRDRKTLGGRRLSRIARAAASPRVRRVAQAALALRQLKLEREFLPDVDGEFIGHAALLTWVREASDDLLIRIYDDFTQLASEAEFYDWCGEHPFDLSEPAQFAEWAGAMQPRFEAIRLLDALIHELSSGDWSRIPKGIA